MGPCLAKFLDLRGKINSINRNKILIFITLLTFFLEYSLKKFILVPNYRDKYLNLKTFLQNNILNLINSFKVLTLIIKGGVTPQNFEIVVCLKGPPSGRTFWLGLEIPDH